MFSNLGGKIKDLAQAMRRKIIFITILSMVVAMLSACSGAESSNEITTGDKTDNETSTTVDSDESAEEETTTVGKNDETTAEQESSGEDLTEEETTTADNNDETITEQEPTKETSTEKETTKPTQKPTVSETDKTADYKAMEEYAKRLGCDYTYLNTVAEYKKYAEAHEGKTFAIICKTGAFRDGSDFPVLPTYDVANCSWANGNSSYECWKFTWALDSYATELQESNTYVKTYILGSESEIDAVIADFAKMANVGEIVKVALVYREDKIDLSNKISTQIRNTNFEMTSYNPLAYEVTSWQQSVKYKLACYCVTLEKQFDVVIPEGVVEGVSDFRKVAKDLAMNYPDVKYQYVSTDEEFAKFAESHVGEDFGVIFPIGTIRRETSPFEFSWPELSVEGRIMVMWRGSGVYYESAIFSWY